MKIALLENNNVLQRVSSEGGSYTIIASLPFCTGPSGYLQGLQRILNMTGTNLSKGQMFKRYTRF